MRKAAAIQHLRQIAALGLGGGVAIPEMLAVLEDIVPGAFNSFFWIDARGQLLDFYAPVLIRSAFEALIVNYDQLTQIGEPTFDKIVGVGMTVGSAGVLHAQTDYSRSIVRNEVWRPYGIGLGLDLVLRDASGARAILFVNREERHASFTAVERRTLLELRHHFLHALDGAFPVGPGAEMNQAEIDTGVVVTDEHGAVLSCSASALGLMIDLLDAPLGPALEATGTCRRLPPTLRTLLERLRRINSGELSAPAMMERRTRRGFCRAKAFAQHAVDGGADQIVFVLSRHLPRAAAMMRRLAEVELSPRERQLALQIGLGQEPEAAFDAIGVSLSTGRGYLKSIYRRLEIPGRAGLQLLLQTPQRAVPPGAEGATGGPHIVPADLGDGLARNARRAAAHAAERLITSG